MELTTIQSIIESGGTFGFALLVWWELRQMRAEFATILHRLDERTRKD